MGLLRKETTIIIIVMGGIMRPIYFDTIHSSCLRSVLLCCSQVIAALAPLRRALVTATPSF